MADENAEASLPREVTPDWRKLIRNPLSLIGLAGNSKASSSSTFLILSSNIWYSAFPAVWLTSWADGAEAEVISVVIVLLPGVVCAAWEC